MKAWLEKLKTGPKEQICILVLAGILLLVIAIPVETEKEVLQEIPYEHLVPTQISKQQELEEQLKYLLEHVSGVGKTEVMIILKSDGQRIVEKDIQVSEGKENNGETSVVTTEQKERSEITVFEKDEQGREIPYVMETMEPEITGVLVAAQGAGNPVIVNEITQAVKALFGVEVHKIKVMKME